MSDESNTITMKPNPLLPDEKEGEVIWTRWARVFNGVVQEDPTEYPVDPNSWYSNDLPEEFGSFYLCPDPNVICWWLYDYQTQVYSLPPPLPPPAITVIPPASVESMIMEIKNNPTLRDQLRELLLKD